MRKLAIGLALASTVLATPAMARDGQWYVGVDGGVTIVDEPVIDIVGSTASGAQIEVDQGTGSDFGGVVGYDFGPVRLESEVSFREADVERVGSLGAVIQNGATVLRSGSFDAVGDTNALSFMVNGLFDFGPDDGLQGFFGGGVGIARVENEIGLDLTVLDDSDTGFAWQILTGIRAPLSDRIDIGIKYRYFEADGIELVDSRGRNFDTDFTSHSILGSLIYNFGGEAPPPPPPPPVATPCNTGPYIVFFDHDKSDLRADGASTLDNAYSQYANCGNARVMLAGHADKSGSNSYNVALSERRNAVVRGYLESKGISAGAIATEAFGETAPLVNTADGVREPQNRRVEVTYGPGSGN